MAQMNWLPAAISHVTQPRRYCATPTSIPATIVGILATSLAVAANVSVHQVDQNNYEFLVTNSSPLSETEAHALIATTAVAICKNLTPVPGKWRFESKEKIGGGAISSDDDTYRFIQEVSCIAGAVAMEGERHPTLHAAGESLQIQEEVKRKSEEYFRLIVAGELDAAYAQVSASRLGTDEAAWKHDKKSFLEVAGNPLRISIVKITVYDNPAEAPEPGLYVAADFGNEFKNVPIQCGYLMWFRPAGGNFLITREEAGYVTSQQLKSIPSIQLPEIKRRLRCVAP